jgi:uncharacterized protein DUF3617
MKNSVRIALMGLLPLSAAFLAAAAQPRALAGALGGLWEVSQSASGHNATRLCVPSPEVLAQYEHRQGRCTRVVISDRGTETVIHYTCADGGFGQSKVTLLTPRSMRIDTQGISGNLPFHYQLHARRVGECAGR